MRNKVEENGNELKIHSYRMGRGWTFAALLSYMRTKSQNKPINNTIMEKERKITAPEGCEIEKVELIDGVAVVTFREKDRKLPKSWEEFCEMYPNYTGDYYIIPDNDEKIDKVWGIPEGAKRTYRNAELLPNRETAEAVLALCQLIQMCECYNQGWKPDWKDENRKYTIDFYEDEIFSGDISSTPSILTFKTRELRDQFLENFRDLIEKLKPLYGIMEGGEE